ncbi:MAG: hypothetical protein NTX99_11140 [Candidatus Aminicenantes bacterium]|nr:hypothetical protein [Candidatus Aminicenantes bacterium]
MIAHTPRLTAVLLAALFVITLTTAADQAKKWDGLLGIWDVKTEDGAREFVFEFTLKDDKLAGKFSGASGTSEMANLTFENNTVKFSVTVGNGMVIDFSAIVAEDKLSGMLSLQYGEAGITGTRRK